MKTRSMKAFILVLSGLSLTTTPLAATAEVPYPKGYRAWHHVKSMVIEEGHALFASFGGIHHIYANDKAMAGYRDGRFPDGAVIVFDLMEAVRNNGALTEGKRKVLGVMHKDARKFAATGGWGFEGFAGGEPTKRVVGNDAVSACFACHQPQKAQDYTFSRLRD